MKSVIETQAEQINQDANDLFAKTITRLNQEMLALKEAHDHIKFEYQRMVKFYDKQVGTPCEEIRHAQEVEVYKEHIEELTATIQSQAKMIGDQGQEIATLKELKDSAKWRMEQLATYTLEQGKLVLSLQAKLGNTERITSLQEQIIEVGLANKVLLNSQYGALGAPGYPEGDEWP